MAELTEDEFPVPGFGLGIEGGEGAERYLDAVVIGGCEFSGTGLRPRSAQIVAKTLRRRTSTTRAMILLIALSSAAQMIASTIAITKSTAAPNSRSSPSSDHMPPPPGMATQREAVGSVADLIRLR